MVTDREIRQAIEPLEAPGLGRSLGSLNLVRSIKCSDHRVTLELASPAMNELAENILKIKVTKELEKLPGIKYVELAYTKGQPAELNAIKHVIAVMSGKGGVGKSLVSGLLATGLRRQGYSVGILDADITGPSIPKMFGLREKPKGCSEGIMPVLSASGIPIMSINLLLDSEDGAVIWRGPLIAKAITQFWEEVFWGKLDYLIVDLPPGTADAPLTVIKSLPVAGLVIVSTPQELASMIVRKAVSMARSTGSRILGVVENMSYLYLSDIDRRIELFGPSRGEELAKAADAPLLAQLPLDPDLAKICDEGHIEECRLESVEQLATKITDLLSKEQKGAENDG